ncbi:hypothetical protein [Pararhizobium gei]|uniref:hypothetical protein n=1 Tax=Pararhizobium gei TaxID=1395951 RepID=UPI0023DABC00|nr:hypothetical protein [Rhizobium gei]
MIAAMPLVCGPADTIGCMTVEQAKSLIIAAAGLHGRLIENGYSTESANGRDPMITTALTKIFNGFSSEGERPLYAPGDMPAHFFILDKLDDITGEEIEQRIVEVLCEEFAVPLCAALVRDGFLSDPEFAELPARPTANA